MKYEAGSDESDYDESESRMNKSLSSRGNLAERKRKEAEIADACKKRGNEAIHKEDY